MPENPAPFNWANITGSYIASGAVDNFGNKASLGKPDVLEVKSRVENKQQAEAKAKAALHNSNSQECTGSMSMPGNTLIIAGNNFELTGMGTLSGINHIISSKHTIDSSGGYITTCEVKRVAKIDANKFKPKSAKVKTRPTVQQKSITGADEYSWGTATGNLKSSGAFDNFNK